ncbi:MAG: AMP-binding protein, partial [Solirubrobacterales bacterium]
MLTSASLGEDAALLDLLVEATQGAFERLVLAHSDFCQSRITSPGQGSCFARRGRGQPALTLPERPFRAGLAEHSRGPRSGQTTPTLDPQGPAARSGSRIRPERVVRCSDRTEADALPTLLDLLTEAVAANGDKTALRLRLDDGTTTAWSYLDLDRRSRLAAWRLRALGLEVGDRILTWSPSTPELPATYFGAMRAGLIIVPLDLRMSADAVNGIVAASGARHLILGTGRDAPDPREAGLDGFPTTTV